AVTTVDRETDRRMPHWKAADRWLCVGGTAGHEAPEALRPRAGEAVVSKTHFSAFGAPALERELAALGSDTLVLAGVHLHGCVRATALDAYQRGLEVWIADDAVGSDDPLHAAVTRRYLETRAARFLAVDEVLTRLAGRAALDPPRLAHRSPRRTAETLFSIPVGGARETAAASAAASAAGPAWRARSEADRRAILTAVAETFERAAEALARSIAEDVGKPLSQARAEVARTAALVRNAAALTPGGEPAAGSGSRFRRVPRGVVAAVTPWNNPLAIPWGKIAPAVALSNAVVWKPAPPASRVAVRSLELAREAGLPGDLVDAVPGDHRTAAALMGDAAVEAVTLSGSSTAGWAAQEVCARRRIPLQAELGGNNASIVWTGADLGRAAALVAAGAFAFAGQRCTANRRAVVETGVFDAFLDRLAAATGALAWGDPLDPATEVGPLVSADARDRVAATLAAARASGASTLAPHAATAGARELEAAGAYLPPTIVVGAPPDAEIVQEETFGPVLVVERAASFDEALVLANGVRQGLVAALFSGPGPWRERFREAARAGVLKWDASTADADAVAPFGGWKTSGIGPPERGPGDLEFYTRVQTLYGEA
ncbi:MAG TPA: aldehyde dehydrogenase family protein, partial [Thermoanaerobaculia bacterium]|nr:aldehyde dehydrogenase family protein [Thermoanaerobaculia bacterium]